MAPAMNWEAGSLPTLIALLLVMGMSASSEEPTLRPGQVELCAGDLRLVLADNQAYGEVHRAGHNGVSELYSLGGERSLYYGVFHGKAVVFMFERPKGGEVRLAQSPSGGGEGNPAWDFVFFKRGYRVGEMSDLRMRLVYRDFRGVEDVVRAYEEWSGQSVERPHPGR